MPLKERAELNHIITYACLTMCGVTHTHVQSAQTRQLRRHPNSTASQHHPCKKRALQPPHTRRRTAFIRLHDSSRFIYPALPWFRTEKSYARAADNNARTRSLVNSTQDFGFRGEHLLLTGHRNSKHEQDKMRNRKCMCYLRSV